MRALIGIGLAAGLLVACEGGEGDPVSSSAPRAEYVAEVGRWDWYFDDLPSMVATAEIVVSGTVTATEPGRETGEEEAGSDAVDNEPKMRLRSVTLQVDEVFKGDVTADSAVVLEEFGYDRTGTAFEIEDLPWSIVGDTGVFFLYRDPVQPSGHFFQVNPDGRLLFEGETVVSFADTPLGEELGSLAARNVGGVVETAISDAERRDLPPQERLSAQRGEVVERDSHPRERREHAGESGTQTHGD